MTFFFTLLGLLIGSFLATIILHELTHLLVARLLGVKATFRLRKLQPEVLYSSGASWWKIVIISLSAPVSGVIIGLLLPGITYLIPLKLCTLLNIFELIPYNSDGEAALYAYLRHKKNGR